MLFKAGDWIRHPKFGNGLVIAHEEPYYVVRFVTEGEKRLQAAFVTEAGTPPSHDFRFPDATRVSKRNGAGSSNAKKPALSFEHFVERFIALYPGGFHDLGFVRDERDYKLAAVEKLNQGLNLTAIDSLLTASDFAEVCRRAKQVASSLNLIFPQEMMAFNDALKASEAQRDFALALRDVLFSDTAKKKRFGNYFDVLAKIGCPKWTIATYFQFLESAGADMFMKPMVSQAMANAVGISLLYRPDPNWDTCVRLNEISAEVESRLKGVGLIPRDWIDLQSFMYVSWQSSK